MLGKLSYHVFPEGNKCGLKEKPRNHSLVNLSRLFLENNFYSHPSTQRMSAQVTCQTLNSKKGPVEWGPLLWKGITVCGFLAAVFFEFSSSLFLWPMGLHAKRPSWGMGREVEVGQLPGTQMGTTEGAPHCCSTSYPSGARLCEITRLTQMWGPC